METAEDAKEFITECDSMIAKIETDPQPMFKQFEDLFGRVENFKTFQEFYIKFLKGCPNQQIVKGHDTPEEAKLCWNTIDVNNNDDLDEDEQKVLVQAIIRKAKDLTTAFFKL